MTRDFTFDHGSDDIEPYPDTDGIELIKEDYQASTRGHAKMGLALIFTPFLIFIVAFLAPAGSVDEALIITLVCTMFLAAVGVIVFSYYGLGTTILFKGFDILTRIGPPEPIIAMRYAITKVNDVYLLAHGLTGHLYILAFRGTPQITLSKKIKLPRAFYKWESRFDIAGAKMFRREGTFSIPISQEECVSGEAVLYGVQYQPTRYSWGIPEFSREQLMAIIEHITEDANRLY